MTPTELADTLRQAGLSQKEFAEVIGYRKETVNRIVRGKTKNAEVPRVVEFAAVALWVCATMRSRLEGLADERPADDPFLQGYASAFNDVARPLEDRRAFVYPKVGPTHR